MWKKYAFGTLIASFLTGGVLWYNSTRSVVTTEDKAAVIERYLALRAIVAPWPFTTNVAGPAGLRNAFGGSAYNPTNVTNNIRAWSFYGYAPTSYPALMLYTPPELMANVMTNLPFLCTNFVESIGTNTDGSLAVNYWSWTNLCNRAGIGNKTSLWTSCYASNGLPLYGAVVRGPMTTTTLWEIWRAETNLHTTVRVGDYNPSSTHNEYRHFTRANGNEITLGFWPGFPDAGIIRTYDYVAQYAYSSDQTAPSAILLPDGFAGTFTNAPCGVWNMRDVYTNSTPGIKVPWEDVVAGVSFDSPPGQYYRNDFPEYMNSYITYRRKVTATSVPDAPAGTYEAIYATHNPAYINYMVTKTNFYTVRLAVFPSNICVTASVVTACALDFTNLAGTTSEEITDDWAMVTNVSGDGYNGPANGMKIQGRGFAYSEDSVWIMDAAYDYTFWDDASGYYLWDLSGGSFPITATPRPEYSDAVGTFQIVAYDHPSGSFVTTTEGFVITNRTGVSTSHLYGVEFAGELATGLTSTIRLECSPVMSNMMTDAEMVRPVTYSMADIIDNPWLTPEGVTNENNTSAIMLWAATNVIFRGQCVAKGSPICVLRWYFK
jgi:hypothetical protein